MTAIDLLNALKAYMEDKVKDMIYHQQLNLFTNQQNINQKDEKKALEKLHKKLV